MIARCETLGLDVADLSGASLTSSMTALGMAIDDGVDRIVVCGGDGMIHHAAGVIAGSAASLGIVPAGTGNDIARAFGVPSQRADAIELALGSATRRIDTIRCGERHTVSVVTAGFSHDVSARADAFRWRGGQWIYTVATLRELPRLRSRHATLVIDGTRVDTGFTLLAVGNTAWFGGGMNVCPDAVPDDGLMDVVVIGDVGRAEFARVFPRVFGGGHVRHQAVSTWRAGRVELSLMNGDATGVWGDGERIGDTPVVCEVVPGSLLLAASH